MKLNRITALLMLSSMPFISHAATYTVVELPTKDLSANQYANSIDNTGLMLTTVNSPYNPPIDLSLIDLSLFALTDPDEAAAGNFNTIDLTIVMAIIKQALASDSILVQQFATNLGYKTDGTSFSYINGFDSVTDATNGYTFALDGTAADSVNGTHVVGTMEGPFTKNVLTSTDAEDLTYLLNDFSFRAFVQVNDTVSELIPEDQTLGGVSRAFAVNDNLQVAGMSSIGVNAILQGYINDCNDDELRGDVPLELCLANLRIDTTTDNIDPFTNRVKMRAAIWQVDATGRLISETVYGLLYEPETDSTIEPTSSALDINNSGVAVGASSIIIQNVVTEAAVVFENGQMQRLLSDDDLLPNRASAINDNDYVAGYRVVTLNGASRAKLFVLNRNNEEITLEPGFFVSSSTFPRAINNNNLVVGDAESDASQNPRGRNGFLYDIQNESFTNLNDLIACDSPFTIIAANDINDSNEILAEAVTRVPSRDIKGEIFIDTNGDEIIRDKVVTVKLIPTGGEPSVCKTSEEELKSTKRQGAGLGIFSLLGLFAIALLRRRARC